MIIVVIKINKNVKREQGNCVAFAHFGIHTELTEKHLIIFCRAEEYFRIRVNIVRFDSSLNRISRKSSDSDIWPDEYAIERDGRE